MAKDYERMKREIARLRELSNRFLACNDDVVPGLMALGETLDEIVVSLEDSLEGVVHDDSVGNYEQVIDQAIQAINWSNS